MSIYDETYTSRSLLKCCPYKNLYREIGVRASRPFGHQGLGISIELEYESVSINTASYGATVPADEWTSKAIEMTATVIGDLDAVIAELQQHKRRLLGELAALAMKE